MKFSLTKFTLISISFCTLCTVFGLSITNVKAQSLTENHNHNQAISYDIDDPEVIEYLNDPNQIPYPIDNPNIIQYRNDCINKQINLDVSPLDAAEFCNCTLNVISKYYTYHNSSITLEHLQHLLHDARNQNTTAVNIINDAEDECL